MMPPRLIAILLAILPVLVGTAAAELDPAFAARLRDMAATARLEQRLADLLESRDRAGLRALAAEIRARDGKNITALADAAAGGAGKASDDLLLLGPCDQAGLSIRLLALNLADGKLEASRRNGTLVISPRESADRFAEDARRCEILFGLPPTKRRIGSVCLLDGDCDGDE